MSVTPMQVTLRTASGENQALLVLDTSDTPLRPTQTLRGTLIDMGYEPASSSVVVRFEAIHTLDDGRVMSRRFEGTPANRWLRPTPPGS